MRVDDINSLEAEAGIIASLIHKPDFIFFSDDLFPSYFTSSQNRYIYIAIQDLVSKGIRNIDAYNIIEDLSSSEATKRYADELTIEGLQELIELSDILARNTTEEYRLLVSNVVDAALRRTLLTKLKECESLCCDRSAENLERSIYELVDEAMLGFSTTEDVPEFKDVVDDVWQQIENHQDGNESGIPFKFPTLNQYVTIDPQELIVVGAPKKGAKSMFMLNEAVDLLRQDKSVMYIDSELSDRLFLCRLVSHLTGIEFVRIRNGRYNEEEKERIREAILWVKSKKFIHLYIPIFERETIYKAVRKASHRFGKLDILMVDYLKATGEADAYATYAELGKLSDMIKNDIAGAMDIAAIAAAQLTDTGKLADSAKIARNASTVILLLDKDPKEIAADGINCGNKKMIVQFNRNGAQHIQGEYIDIKFNGSLISLEEAEQHQVQAPY